MLLASPAQAASLQEVTGWSNNDVPTYISMYIYVPDKLATDPPIMVAAHYCGGSATAYYSFDSAVVSLANTYGFIMIFPQTTNPASSADCWDVGSTKSLTHNGGGDTQAIAEMVQYTITKYSANAGRVYSMGSSSGAMLTEALMGVYPEVFKAGAEMSGVPDGCWSDGWSAQSNWGGTCASGGDMMTAMAWGNLVRAQYPGYTGTRPRLWLWVGSADTTISPNNFTQAILEWTNVLDLSSTPTSTTPANNANQQQGAGQLWSNSCGDTVLEAWELQGGGHAPTPTASTAAAIVSFFGLDKTSATDPGAGCGDAGSTGGADASTGGGDASSVGKDAGTVGNDASSVGQEASTVRNDASSVGQDASTVGNDASGVANDASGVGADASSVDNDATITIGTDASVIVGNDASTVGTDASSLGSDAGIAIGDAGIVVAIGDAGSGGSSSDGGSSTDNGSAGCGCRIGPADQRFKGMLFAPIGAVLGILVRRRRRSRA
jgi:poly(hydroxyalkanoate) depolymerase family esterase